MLKTEAYQNSTQFIALSKKNGFKAAKLYSYKPTDGTGDITWTRGSTAYRLNQEGLLELMGNNVPRVDYSNTCPELLIEPQSTNFLTHSEDFSNVAWSKNNISITTNAIEAPNGTMTADKIEATLSSTPYILQSKTLSGLITLSIFAKAGNVNNIFVDMAYGGNDYIAIYNLSTGAYVGNGGYNNPLYRNIKSIGNGWYRIDITNNVGTSTSVLSVIGVADGNTINGLVNTNINIWGTQIEESIFATSYIPTTNTSVTRSADVAHNNTIDYSGDGGTIFVRARISDNAFAITKPLVTISDDGTTLDNYISIYVDGNRQITATTYNNPDQNDYSYTPSTDGIANIAFAWKESDNSYAFAVNGVVRSSGIMTNAFTSNLFGRLDLGKLGSEYSAPDNVIGCIFFNTKLDNTSLANITA